ncbi:MAG: glycosyltransferase family 2 protein [Clostridia bacterium]|nr:glycosyltransferase family 2 protein [Clostridia bacterium]
MTVSLCMIVKNEQEVLARCLESVKDAVDEIIIVDTGSDDDTREIASRYTDKVYSYPWHDDFASARNFAFSKGTGDYLMWLDADDILPEGEAEKLSAFCGVLDTEQPDFVECPYETTDGNGNPSTTFFRERLLKREAGFQWVGRVHECIAPRGKRMQAPFRVRHLGSKKPRGMRNLHIYEQWAAEEKLSPRDLFYYGRELYYNRLYTPAIAVLGEMLAGDGWYVNKIEACKILAYCHRECGEKELAVFALLRSFAYGKPRASVLCELGKHFTEAGQHSLAAFWYERALECADHSAEGDFEEPSCRGIIPLIELTCCYYALGDKAQAYEYHKRAEALDPSHPAVGYNRDFFKKIGMC